MFAGKPVIGIVGGIGSGKTFVARCFGDIGALVISADEQVRELYSRPDVKQTLHSWWGDAIFKPDGDVNRSAIAKIVFSDPSQRSRLEHFLHPRVIWERDSVMLSHSNDAQVLAYVWDTPLLVETGVHRQCDKLVFVDCPMEIRLLRLQQSRGWNAAELESREKLQLPLDKKREISDYVIGNAAGADRVRNQVRDVFSQILAELTPPSDAAL